MGKKETKRVVKHVRRGDITTIALRKETSAELYRGIEDLFDKLTPTEALPFVKRLRVIAKKKLRKSLLGE